jgi:hypothetical protein
MMAGKGSLRLPADPGLIAYECSACKQVTSVIARRAPAGAASPPLQHDLTASCIGARNGFRIAQRREAKIGAIATSGGDRDGSPVILNLRKRPHFGGYSAETKEMPVSIKQTVMSAVTSLEVPRNLTFSLSFQLTNVHGRPTN